MYFGSFAESDVFFDQILIRIPKRPNSNPTFCLDPAKKNVRIRNIDLLNMVVDIAFNEPSSSFNLAI